MEIDVAAEVPKGATLVVAVADPPGMLPAAADGLAGPRGDYLRQRGGTGYGVRLLAELASRLASR